MTRTRTLSRRAACLLLLAVAAGHAGLHLAWLPAEPVSACFHDELHYAQYARDIARGAFPHYNRDWTAKFPPAYPAALAPAWWLGGRRGFAWWSRVLNIALLTSVLIPAYRLARLQMDRGWALAAAGLALLGSFQAFARFLFAEILLIPLLLWLVLAFTRLAARPTTGRALGTGVLFGLVVLTKMAMVGFAPALVLALGWARRSARDAIRHGAALGAGAAVTVLPYVFRAHLFPSEAARQPGHSYLGEFTGGGTHYPLGVYVHHFVNELAFATLALGLPFLILALLGLFSQLGSRDPRRRAFAALVVSGGLCLDLVVAVWLTHNAYYANVHQERYFLALWPLLSLALVGQLAAPSRHRGALVAACVVGAGAFAALPDTCLELGRYGQDFGLFEVPSARGAMVVAAMCGGPLAARVVLAAPLVLVVPLRRRARGAAAVLLLLAVAYLGHDTLAAVRAAHRLERDLHGAVGPLWRWLEGHLRQGDTLVHHTYMGAIAYLDAMHFDQDVAVVEWDLAPYWESAIALHADAGTFYSRGLPARGRFYLLTRAPGPDGPGVVSRLGEYRLLDATPGLGPLGAWCAPRRTAPRHEGFHADGWCAPTVRLEFPAAVGLLEAGLTLHHPADSPLAGPLRFELRGPGGIVRRGRLDRGERVTFRWISHLWVPEFWLTIEADRHFVRHGRRLAMRLEGFYMKPVD